MEFRTGGFQDRLVPRENGPARGRDTEMLRSLCSLRISATRGQCPGARTQAGGSRDNKPGEKQKMKRETVQLVGFGKGPWAG